MSDVVRIVVVGAGSRGTIYAKHLTEGGKAQIVGVAETIPERRAEFARQFGLTPDVVFSSWEDLAHLPRFADAVVLATPDRMHVEPATVLARSGYHLLLEKPMAPTEHEAMRIVAAAAESEVILAVCHVMRYTAYTKIVRDLIASGRIGAVMSVDHLEPIGWWHFAHSYVRGNWAREETSASMLLAKACHDIDWLIYVLDRDVRRVSSFGDLTYFRPENKPAGATSTCLECPAAPDCAYSAPRIYGRFLGDPKYQEWPLRVLTLDTTPAGVQAALRTGPYGRCVFNGDNDVVDHQVVLLEMDGGATVTLTVSAFTKMDFRKTRVHGTRGYLEGDGTSWRIVDFLTAEEETITVSVEGDASVAGGHGGADRDLARAFVEAVAQGDQSLLLSGPDASLASHRVVWAAEKARVTGEVVALLPS